MKILVTGATGFIGAAVARQLSQQHHEVLALSRSDAAAAKLRVAGLTPVAGDFAVPASLAAPAAQRPYCHPRLGGGGVMRFREGGEADDSGELGRRRHCVPFDRHSQHRGPFRGVSGDQGVRSNALVRQVVPWADLHANPP